MAITIASFFAQPKLGCLWVAVGDLDPYGVAAQRVANCLRNLERDIPGQLARAICWPCADYSTRRQKLELLSGDSNAIPVVLVVHERCNLETCHLFLLKERTLVPG